MAPSKKRKDSSSSSSATRRTRSQVAPDWTQTQTLILVNEIAAIESDCLDALSYYQKWKIIAENCAALDVNRTLDQCRRKWDSLFSNYNAINRWQTGDGAGDSYWSIGREERRSFGMPEEFEREVFDAVDDVVRSHVERRASLVPDNVVQEDADADPLGVITPPLLKRQSHHQLTPLQKHPIEENPDKKAVDDDMETGSVAASQSEQKSGNVDIMARKLAKKTETMKLVATQPSEKADSTEVLGTLLREKAEMIQTILEGKLGENEQYTLTDLKQGRGSCINLVRCQCDKLIDCFSVIASTLEQLCNGAAHI